MLARQYRLRKQNEFDQVFKKGKTVNSAFLVLKFSGNGLGNNRFGFLVGSKIFKKAVLRNKIKRRLREAVKDLFPLIKPGYDLVFIVKSGLIEKKYAEIKSLIESLLKIAGLISP